MKHLASTSTAATQNVDAVRRQVMWNRLIAVVEEQAQTLIRAAFSTAAREAGDVSAGVFTTEGDMVAQAVTGTPGHINTMAAAVAHFLRRFPAAQLREGDVLITNDPWQGTGHLFDFTVVTPAFHQGKLVGFFASTTHVPDIGGRRASPDAREIFEEGLRVPISKLIREGEIDETLLGVIRVNVREPVQVVGDLLALAACNDMGARRLSQMMSEFGLAEIDTLAHYIFGATRRAMLDAIRVVRPGVYHSRMRIDGHESPVDLVLQMSVDDQGITLDFTGSSPQSAFGINVPLCYTAAYACFGVKCAIAPQVPNNAASLGLVRVQAPEGCILNAQDPCAVTARHVVGQMLPDLVFGCLHQAVPDKVPAEGSPLWLLVLSGARAASGDRGTAYALTSFHNGGTGARPGLDGLSATSFPSGVKTVPVEIVETLSPLLFVSKELRTDSGGAGRWRGGLGQTLRLRNLDAMPFRFAAMLDRVVHAPSGRDQGGHGALGRVHASGRPLRSMGAHEIAAGDELSIETPGGGGLGDPHERPLEMVLADIQAGYVSVEQALVSYQRTAEELRASAPLR